MQETKVEDGKFPVGEFEGAGYGVFFKGERQYNGVAIASLEKPAMVDSGLDDGNPPDKDRLIRCVSSGIHIINTYIPQGRERESPHFAYKLEWFRRLRNFLDTLYSPDEPLIWCGDLNVAPEAIDVHDPKRLLNHVCFTPEVREAFHRVKSWGLVDIFRKLHPGMPGNYTFYDYRVPKSVERGLGWRVDHILATPSLAAKSISCTIDMKTRIAERPSDHTVLVAEFKL
jgi:exodeoxyribonuclease-3